MSLRHLDNLPANLLLDLDEALEANEATHAAPASRENTPTLATPAVLQSTLLSR